MKEVYKFNLVKTVSKDIKKPYFNEDMAYCKSIVNLGNNKYENQTTHNLFT